MNDSSQADAPSSPPAAAQRRISLLASYPMAWMVLIISLVASTGGWLITRKHENLSAQKQFEEQAAQIQMSLSERMAVYDDALLGGVGLFSASQSVERSEWRAYMEKVSVNKRFPGIDAIGFVANVRRSELESFLKTTRADNAPNFEVRNPGTNDDLFVVKYLEPERQHRVLLGADFGADAARRRVAESSRDLGTTVISGRLALQDTDQPSSTERRDGFIMLTPVYRNGTATATLDERRTNIVGWIFGRFYLSQLMSGILDKKLQTLRFRVIDRDEHGDESLIFDNHAAADSREKNYESRFSSVHMLSVGRHHWILKFNSKPAYDAAIPRSTDVIVGIGGALISLLLFGIALSLSATRQRAMSMAADLTEASRQVNTRLQQEIAERKQAERRTAAQYTVAKILAEANTLAEATPRLLQSVCELLGWDLGMMWQADIEGRRLHFVDSWQRAGLEVTEFKEASRRLSFPRGEGLPGRVWNLRRPVWIADVVKEEQFPRKPSAIKCGLHAALGFPVASGDQVLGVIEFYSHQIESPDNELRDMMAAIGSQVGQFLERQRSETALQHERYLLKTLMDNLPDRIYFKDLQSRFLRNSRAHLKRFGVATQSEVIGKTDFDFFSKEHAQQAFEDEQEVIRLGQPITKEEKETWPDGSSTWALSTKMPMRDENGEMVGSFGISRDITAGKRAEEALRVAKDAAEEANRAKSQFLASMSHELRTPLNSVIGFANILIKNKAGNLSGAELNFLDRILANGKHLLALINEVLDLSKIEARKTEVQLAPADLGQLIRETVAQQEGLVRDRPVELRTEIPSRVATFSTDADKLKQVIINLVGNALKFTERGSVTVRLMTDVADTPVRIDVTDTGIGIPQEKLGIIFEAFQQAEAGTARKYGGTGLGLTISQALCRLMGYHITVASEVDHGSTFSVVLKPVLETAPVVAEPVKTGSVAPLSVNSSRRVLVIDDEADSRALLSHLVADCGCQVMAASSGAQGLQIAREFHPDLITLDLMMPSMDGWETVRAIKADSQLAQIPVVVVSMVGHDKSGHILGAVDVLQKPVSREDLVTVLQRNLRRPAMRVLIVDDDADARKIMADCVRDRAAEFRSAENGQQALAMLEEFSPDLILLDLVMPVLDGFAFLDWLRRDARFQRLPVIVITSKTLTNAETKVLEQERLQVLKKSEAFEGTLRQLLEGLCRNEP